MPSPRFPPARRRPRVAGRQARTDRRPTDAPAVITLDDREPFAPSGLGGAMGTLITPLDADARRRPTLALVVAGAVLVIALGAAAWFRGEASQLVDSGVTSNGALLDVGATAQVSGQVRDAVERVFSYDFARLDDNERATNDVVTGPFARDYHQQFARVRELAPGQQAVVVATVPALAVKVLDGDRAIVVVFIDQQANRGGQAQPLVAAGRLRVTAQRVDGSWKIADVEPF